MSCSQKRKRQVYNAGAFLSRKVAMPQEHEVVAAEVQAGVAKLLAGKMSAAEFDKFNAETSAKLERLKAQKDRSKSFWRQLLLNALLLSLSALAIDIAVKRRLRHFGLALPEPVLLSFLPSVDAAQIMTGICVSNGLDLSRTRFRPWAVSWSKSVELRYRHKEVVGEIQRVSLH